jgi:hypothetical protein
MYRRKSSSSANCPDLIGTGAAELPLRKEVVHVKYFKITKAWSVKAESEEEAIKQIAADPAQFLESETISRTEYKKPQQKAGGWANGFRNQLLGQQ